MPPFRNPFGRKPPNAGGVAPTSIQDEETRPATQDLPEDGIKRSDMTASRTSSAMSIKPSREEPSEYKLSGSSSIAASASRVALESRTNSEAVVNDSGVYLPVSYSHNTKPWRC